MNCEILANQSRFYYEFIMITCVCVFCFMFIFLSQDGKTAEDLAHSDQHELIVSLLGKLKKVANHTHLAYQYA